MPMPVSTTQMRRFLGCSAFFQKFMPNFSDKTALLTDMVKKDFDWNKKNWTRDYESAFNSFKKALLDSCELFYPDYNLDWILRADASDFGVGFVLLQVAPGDVLQPLLFGSQKFSEQAKKWSTYAKEAFAMFFSMKACEYYLRAKPFTYEGDHANLRWMEQCTEAKVIRWRIYMQTFMFKFNHIAGRANMVADWQSRFNTVKTYFHENDEVPLFSGLHSISTASDCDSQALHVVTRSRNYDTSVPQASSDEIPPKESLSPPESLSMTKANMFASVHGEREGHHGVETTYRLLSRKYANHGFSVADVDHFIRKCPTCRLINKTRETKLNPITRNLKVPSPRCMIGIDYLELTLDMFGNKGVYVIKDHFTLLAYIYPTPEKDTSNAALAIFSFCVLYGKSGGIISDPGSEFTSAGLAQLNSWFGIEPRFSLVDRHESNGVENTNRQILRRLRELVTESDIAKHKATIDSNFKSMLTSENVQDRWSSPHIIYWVSYLINKLSIFETGVSPYELTFGSKANQYFDFPVAPLDKQSAHKYIRTLSEDLEYLQKQCKSFQDNIVEKRKRKDGVLNALQPGDFVLKDIPNDHKRPNKLRGPYRGPYEVQQQIKNDVAIKHLATGNAETEFVSRLSLFIGSREDATAAAFADSNQYHVKAILGYQGNPMARSTMQFYVHFADDEKVWLPYSLDLFHSVAYQTFCEARPELKPLLRDSVNATKWCNSVKRQLISSFKPKMIVYIDIRVFGYEWYQTLDLPDLHTHTYVAPATFVSWETLDKALHLECPLLDSRLIVNNLFIKLHCYRRSFASSANETLLTPQFVRKFPLLLKRTRLEASDYQFLVAKLFSDDGIVYQVTRIAVDRQHNIVAYVRPQRARTTSIAPEDPTPYHVQSVVELVNLFPKRG